MFSIFADRLFVEQTAALSRVVGQHLCRVEPVVNLGVGLCVSEFQSHFVRAEQCDVVVEPAAFRMPTSCVGVCFHSGCGCHPQYVGC